MSFQTTAILFYGIKVASPSDAARDDASSDVRIDCFGSDGNLTHFVAPMSSTYTADLDTSLVLPARFIDEPTEYTTELLRAFCDKHGIAWGNGPAWHLAPVRT